MFISTSMGGRDAELIFRSHVEVHEVKFPEVMDPRSGFCFLPQVCLFSLGLVSATMLSTMADSNLERKVFVSSHNYTSSSFPKDARVASQRLELQRSQRKANVWLVCRVPGGGQPRPSLRAFDHSFLCADLKETLPRIFHLNDAYFSSIKADSLPFTIQKPQILNSNYRNIPSGPSSLRDPQIPVMLPLPGFEVRSYEL